MEKYEIEEKNGKEESALPVRQMSPKISYRPIDRKKRKKKRGIILISVLLVLVFLLSLLFTEAAVRPEVLPLSKMEAERLLSVLSNEIIGEMADSEIYNFENFIQIRYGRDGSILSLQADTRSISQFSSDFALELNRRLTQKGKLSIRLPLGNVTGWSLFAGKGLPLSLAFYPVGSAETEVKSDFEEGGINQTLHKIYLEIRLSLVVILPGENAEIEMTQKVPLSENILLGKVPNVLIQK